jgi:antitoxin (DNA-binding transcriptional repressor) of toxin-antitoxin stability system
MTRLTTDEVSKELFGTLERVAVYGERIVLDRSGKSVAAIVPMEDLELLRRIEDMLDNEAATEAREEPCRVPWSTLKTELNL